MRITVILAHPGPGSFNHAIAETAVKTLIDNEHEVYYHDLYEEKFDPNLPIQEIPRTGAIDSVIKDYCRELTESDGIVIIHPNWWGMPPAILKGWIDRVIRPGVAYQFLEGDSGEGVPIGLLRGKIAIVLNTGDTEPQREQNVFHDPLETIWKNCIFGLCGITEFYRKLFAVIVNSTREQRQAWLEETVSIVNRFFPAKG